VPLIAQSDTEAAVARASASPCATGHGTFAEASPDTLVIDTSRMQFGARLGMRMFRLLET
jgi:hypothetical protein